MAAPKYLDLVSGIQTQKSATETGPAAEVIVATTAAGTIDPSLLPGSISGSVSIVTSDNLSAGAFVNIYNNAGTPTARNADGSTTGKSANGYVLAATTAPAAAQVYTGGINTAVTTVTGGEIYLSDSSPGGFTSTPPSASGHVVQRIGSGVSSTAIAFSPYPPITLA